MSGEPLLQVSGLHRRFGPVHAVRGIDLSLARGEVLGLLGANGAGKTTTMAMLAGVLAPSAGRVRVAGHDLLEQPLAAKARLGYLPETPPLFPDLTVDEYLRHCARLRGIPARRQTGALGRARERCGLADSGPRLIGALSKGYRQRVGIAQAIVHEPDVLILDEPTSGLDPGQLRGIRGLIRELGAHHAVLLSTHVLPEVQSVCTRVQIIHEGATALVASLDELAAGAGRFRLRLARAPSAAELRALDVVDEAIAGDDGVATVHVPGGDDAVARLAAACVERGWGLLELRPEPRSLEDVFMAVCAADPAAGRAA
jgi:ABC-2 type transport system ATP-binding protein